MGSLKLLDGWETPFVAPNGSSLFTGNLFGECGYPKFAPFIAPSVHHSELVIVTMIMDNNDSTDNNG